MPVTVSTTLKKPHPKLPYDTMAADILGKKYDVSLVFIGAKRAKSLNQTYRQKTYIPNVLSFPLTASAGEIYIAPQVAQKEAKNFNLSPRGYIGYLFIHALLHLNGMKHGGTMEAAEARYVLAYNLK